MQLDWPADSRQIYSPARPGKSVTELDFVCQTPGKPAGFMDGLRCLLAFGIFF